MTARPIIYLSAILVSLLVDILFSLGRYPILTVIVCGIVLVYEFVSPYIYSSR